MLLYSMYITHHREARRKLCAQGYNANEYMYVHIRLYSYLNFIQSTVSSTVTWISLNLFSLGIIASRSILIRSPVTVYSASIYFLPFQHNMVYSCGEEAVTFSSNWLDAVLTAQIFFWYLALHSDCRTWSIILAGLWHERDRGEEQSKVRREGKIFDIIIYRKCQFNSYRIDCHLFLWLWQLR